MQCDNKDRLPVTGDKPPITGAQHETPFDKLSPRDFERLCLALLPRQAFDNPRHYGAAGGERGRDIVAQRAGQRWYVQCKRVKQCGPFQDIKSPDAEWAQKRLAELPDE